MSKVSQSISYPRCITSGQMWLFPVTFGIKTTLVVTAIMGLLTIGLTENNAYTIEGYKKDVGLEVLD